jgi:hypothetical protein
MLGSVQGDPKGVLHGALPNLHGCQTYKLAFDFDATPRYKRRAQVSTTFCHPVARFCPILGELAAQFAYQDSISGLLQVQAPTSFYVTTRQDVTSHTVHCDLREARTAICRCFEPLRGSPEAFADSPGSLQTHCSSSVQMSG